jgi:hypothetical protein
MKLGKKNQVALYSLSAVLLLTSSNAFAFGKMPEEIPAPPTAPAPVPKPSSSVKLENLKDGQNFKEDDNAVFYIVASQDIQSVEVSNQGKVLGQAEYLASQKKFRFSMVLVNSGAYDLKFSGKSAVTEMASASFHLIVATKSVPAPNPPSGKNFNAYILKAVEKINQEHSLRGYNINAQLTHDLNYGSKGILKSTFGELTMCVSASLEIIITAYEIYANETGDNSVFDFLPFKSWSTLASTSIKAHIWVDPKLDSYGTADALSHFGIGELVPFSELQPGSFINLNRDNGTGHSVVFISYIDIKANELPAYDAAKVAGFKYFSAQGKAARGQGGFDYRYAFFSKNGCPTISYHRDCGLMYSADRKYLNTGVMWHPRDWRRPAFISAEGAKLMGEKQPAEVSAEDLKLSGRPAKFNGLTTDD